MRFSSRLSRLLTASVLFTGALASLQITNPGKDLWWVANSQNVLTWTCKDSPVAAFTVLIDNKAQLAAPLALVGLLNNFDCSKVMNADQSNRSPGLGYTILLANPLNSTEVYATSEEFEIKPFGSAYPGHA